MISRVATSAIVILGLFLAAAAVPVTAGEEKKNHDGSLLIDVKGQDGKPAGKFNRREASARPTNVRMQEASEEEDLSQVCERSKMDPPADVCDKAALDYACEIQSWEPSARNPTLEKLGTLAGDSVKLLKIVQGAAKDLPKSPSFGAAVMRKLPQNFVTAGYGILASTLEEAFENATVRILSGKKALYWETIAFDSGCKYQTCCFQKPPPGNGIVSVFIRRLPNNKSIITESGPGLTTSSLVQR